MNNRHTGPAEGSAGKKKTRGGEITAPGFLLFGHLKFPVFREGTPRTAGETLRGASRMPGFMKTGQAGETETAAPKTAG